MFTLKSLPEFDAWFADLHDPLVRSAVMKRLKRVQLGLLGDTRSLGDGVSELRLHLGPGWRVYYTQRGRQIIFLLTAGSKKEQTRDIARAKALASTIASPYSEDSSHVTFKF